MEVKEALEILKYYDKQPYFFSKDASANIAFKMAIEALETLEMVKDEFNRPIKDVYSAAVLLCMATSLGTGNCSNCPVTLFDYDKRTEYEKCCLHEPCQTNLYKWLTEQSNK